jgi:hypothetical protein
MIFQVMVFYREQTKHYYCLYIILTLINDSPGRTVESRIPPYLIHSAID